jgi:hypothetical protein
LLGIGKNSAAPPYYNCVTSSKLRWMLKLDFVLPRYLIYYHYYDAHRHFVVVFKSSLIPL